MARYSNLSVDKLSVGQIYNLANGKPVGVSGKYSFVAAGREATAGGATTEAIASTMPLQVTDQVYAEYSTTNDTDVFNKVIVDGPFSLTSLLSADPSTAHAIEWVAVREGGTPAYGVFAAGTFTTAGGDAAESITVTGALASDIAMVQVKTRGASPVTLAAAVCAANAITVTLSADPSTDHVLSYAVLRPLGNFTPSHYIYAAGNHTTVGGSATESITVGGVVAGDIAFAALRVTNDTDSVLAVTTTSDAVSVLGSADPLTAHAYSYIVLRPV